MSLNISVDPSGLTQEQREAVAGFILAFPGAGQSLMNHVHAEVHEATTPPLEPAVQRIVDAAASGDPAAAFGPTPGAVFPLASTPAPAPLAPFAHFIADAATSTTAPGAATVTSAVPNAPQAPAQAPGNAATVAAPPTGNPVTLDKHGLPWDGRIHGEKKNQNADGTWRKRKGVDPALVAQVEAELRAVMAAAPAAPIANGVSTTVAASAPGAWPIEQPATQVPPAPAPAAAPTVDPRAAYVALIGRASAAIQAGKLTQVEAGQCCAAYGVPALPLLANRLDLVPQVAADIDAIIASRP